MKVTQSTSLLPCLESRSKYTVSACAKDLKFKARKIYGAALPKTDLWRGACHKVVVARETVGRP